MKPYAKAIIAALVAGLGTASTALVDGRIDPSEWVAIAASTLVALGATYGVPNGQR